MEPRLILTVGIPGCGKSSWLEAQCLDPEKFIIVSPDRVRKEVFGNITDQAHNIEVFAAVRQRTVEFLKLGYSVIVDATNVNTTNRKTFIKDLPPCKLQAKIFINLPAECCERVRKDIEAGKDRSNVPNEAIYRMYGELLYTMLVIESEGFELIETIKE